jgi:hypothetical protein
MKPRMRDATLLGGGRVLGHGLGAFRHGVLGQLAGEDKSDTACGLARVRRVVAEEIRTRSGFRVMRWSTSCCRRQAWRPRWRRAQRCLQTGSANATWQKADALTVNKGVEDAHGAVADTGVGVHLLEDCDASD